jgi:hypothetical protein
MANDLAEWLACASADAEARALPALQPLLQTLARSLQALRDADAQFGHPAGGHLEAAEDDHHAR